MYFMQRHLGLDYVTLWLEICKLNQISTTRSLTFNVDPVGLVQTPVIETKIRSCSGSCSSLRQTSLSLLLSPTQCCCCMAQWSTFTISAFSLSLCLSGKLQAENRAQSFMVYINHNTFSAQRRRGRDTSICFLFAFYSKTSNWINLLILWIV